jgi:hypothetical protein
VALLDRDTMPHRLDFPVQVYLRYRNQIPVDQMPPAASMSFGDMDQDGNDELLVASATGIVVIEKLADQLAANPEKAPTPVGYYVTSGSPVSAVAVDMDGDQKLDLVAVDSKERRSYYHHNLGGRGMYEAPRIAELPATGIQVVRTGCREQPVVIVLSDGRLMGLDKLGAAKLILPTITSVKSAAAAGGALLFQTSQATYLYDACAQLGSQLGLPMKSYTSLAMTQSGPGAQSLAVLTSDTSVSLMHLFSGF